MTLFVCAVQLDGGPVPDAFQRDIETVRWSRSRRWQWTVAEGCHVAVDVTADSVRPSVVRVGTTMSVGVARLDNRTDLLRSTACCAQVSDLELATRVVMADGPDGVPSLLGDFSFVVWDVISRAVVAARDALGVKPLYYAIRPHGLLVFSTRAELLASGDAYDLAYLIAHIAYCTMPPERTVYAGVRALPAGHTLSGERSRVVVTPYWAPDSVRASDAAPMSEKDLIDALRALLIDAVRLRLGSGQQTWSHLSGGLDSSSVVSVAQWLAETEGGPAGLAGTISYIDPATRSADEQSYSGAVVHRYGVPNVTIAHQIDWRAVIADPPNFDQPSSGSYLVTARDRQAVSIIRQAGGNILLTGEGGDHLFLGTMFFFSDWLVRGRVAHAAREMLDRAARGRVSFWELAYKNAVLPILPARVRHVLSRHSEVSLPAWIARDAARRYGLRARTGGNVLYSGSLGHKYAGAMRTAIGAIQATLGNPILDEALDVRHPFLYRPLVEFAMRLPPEMCVRPHARKWILREALRGVLPEVVRTRVGKATAEGLLTWSLRHERAWIAHLLDAPILAQLGCIDLAKFRAALNAGARHGVTRDDPSFYVHKALETEMWLRLRSGRWEPPVSQACTLP